MAKVMDAYVSQACRLADAPPRMLKVGGVNLRYLFRDWCASPASPKFPPDSSSSTGRRGCGLPDRGYATKSRGTRRRQPWSRSERAAWQKTDRGTARPNADTLPV